MKNSAFWFIALLAFAFQGALNGQSKIVDLGMFKNPQDHSKLEVRLRSAETVNNGSYSAGIFTVRVPSSYGVTLSVVPGSSPFGYTFAGPVGQADGYDYYRYQFSGSVYFVNWEKEQEYPVATLQVSGKLPPNAVFELVTNNDWTRKHNGDYYQELNGSELERSFFVRPLRLIHFKAAPLSDRTVKLNWEFESEASLAYTEIEYSEDGREFSKIGTEPARGGEKNLLAPEYDHLHLKPANMNFYRIRAVDIDGKAFFSPVQAINFSDLKADFAVFPNPCSGALTLVSRDLQRYSSGLVYQVLDNAGKVVMTNIVTSDNEGIDLSRVASGPYFIKVVSGEEQLAKFKVVVTK